MELTRPPLRDSETQHELEMWSAACRCDLHARWESAQARLERFEGVLGRTAVEPEVQLAVTALQALGIPTYASCGGHMREAGYIDMPYIAIGFVGGKAAGGRMERPLTEWLRRIMLDLGYDLAPAASRLTMHRGFKSSVCMGLPSWRRTSPVHLELAQSQMRDLGEQLRDWYFAHGAANCPCKGHQARSDGTATGLLRWPVWVREMHAERFPS